MCYKLHKIVAISEFTYQKSYDSHSIVTCSLINGETTNLARISQISQRNKYSTRALNLQYSPSSTHKYNTRGHHKISHKVTHLLTLQDKHAQLVLSRHLIWPNNQLLPIKNRRLSAQVSDLYYQTRRHQSDGDMPATSPVHDLKSGLRHRPIGLKAYVPPKKPWCWGSSPQTISQSAWHNTKLEELSLQHLSWIPTDLYAGLKSANKIQCPEWIGLSWSFKHEITWSWEIPLEFIWISLTIMSKCCSSWMVSAWQ